MNHALCFLTQMLTTELGSTWPVGLVGGSMWEGCVTDPKDRSKIIDFWCIFRPWRRFPFDMAAFAVNARLFTLFPTAQFDYYRALEQEGVILSQLGFRSAYDLEPKANGCSKVITGKKINPPRYFSVCSISAFLRSRYGYGTPRLKYRVSFLTFDFSHPRQVLCKC